MTGFDKDKCWVGEPSASSVNEAKITANYKVAAPAFAYA